MCPAFALPVDSKYTLDAVMARAAQTPRDVAVNGHQGRERRRSARVTREGCLLIKPHIGGATAAAQRVRFRDVSAAGLGFIHEMPLPPGAQFIVELPGRGSSKTILYTVVRCIPGDDGQFRIGARMSQEQLTLPSGTKPISRLAS
jgi:hypothetical protein